LILRDSFLYFGDIALHCDIVPSGGDGRVGQSRIQIARRRPEVHPANENRMQKNRGRLLSG